MKLIYIFIFFCINILSLQTFSKNIAVINIQSLIDNNITYKNIINEIELSQQKYLNDFKSKENELELQLEEIENSKLILTENEINLQVDNYNRQISEFSIMIEEYNYHYQNQIIKIRESILGEIIKIIEKYAIENNIDLILDSTSYLIASNSLDITQIINIELENIKIKLEYEEFKRN